MKKASAIGALILAAALFPTTPSMASTIGTDFESFALGSPHGQDGWKSDGSAGLGCAVYDHSIVDATTYPHLGGAFGSRALRISNAVVSGCFGDQTFSKPLPDEVGENDAVSGGFSGGARVDRFETSWDFTSADPSMHQAGLQMGISADRGDGARMNLIRLRDLPAGLVVEMVRYQSGGTCAGGTFPATTIASGLARGSIHTLRFEITTVEGTNNDLLRIWVDGALVHSGLGSWEDFFRQCQPPGSRTMDSVLLRTGGVTGTDDAPATAGKGFLIDNVGETSIDPPAPPTITSPSHGSTVPPSFTVSGTGPANKGVRLENGGTPIATTSINASGQWSINLNGQSGSLSLRAFATDGGVDSIASNLVNLAVQPGGPIIISPFEGQVLTTNSFTISGSAGPGMQVTVRKTSPVPTVVLGTVTADAGGAWSMPTGFPDGSYTIDATAQTPGGFPSAPAVRSFRINTDTTPPAMPVIRTPAENALSPALVTISGSGEIGSVVTVEEGSSQLGQAVTQANGEWSMQIVMTTGPHGVTALASDRSGNASTDTAVRSFTVDADAPTVTISTGDLTASIGPVTIEGTAGDGRGVARVEIRAFDLLGAEVFAGEATLSAPGGQTTHWEAQPPVGPTGVIATIRATALDTAGNRSAPRSIRVIAIGG